MDGELDDAEVERVVGELPAAGRADGLGVLPRDRRRAARHARRVAARCAARFAARSRPSRRCSRRSRASVRPAASWAWAAAATVAAVTVVGWTAVSLTRTPGTAVAKAREAACGHARRSCGRRRCRRTTCSSHQEYSPATAIQGVRPYLRAVSAPAVDGRVAVSRSTARLGSMMHACVRRAAPALPLRVRRAGARSLAAFARRAAPRCAPRTPRAWLDARRAGARAIAQLRRDDRLSSTAGASRRRASCT